MQTIESRSHRFLTFLLVGTGLLSLFILRSFIITLALAVIFAVVLHPLYVRILNKLGQRRASAALLTIFMVSLCVLVPLSFIGTRVFGEAQQVYISLVEGSNTFNAQTVVTNLGAYINTIVPGGNTYINTASLNINTYIKQGLGWALQNAGGLFSQLAQLFVHLFILLMALYYLLTEGKALRAGLIQRGPLLNKDITILLDELSVATNSVVRGTIGTAIVQGVAATIGFLLFGVPNAFLWGVVIIFTALIPSIGTSLVLIPAVLYLLVVGHTTAAVGLAVWAVLAVGSIDNIVGPRLSGHGTKLNPLLTLLSVFGGLSLFGLSGALLGPIILSFFFTVFTVHSSYVEGV